MIPGFPVLIACALERETQALREVLGKRARYATTGMGMRRTAARLSEVLRGDPPSTLLFCGTAGQLDPSLAMGEVVLPEAWLFEDGRRVEADAELLGRFREAGWSVGPPGLTVRRPVLRPSTRLRLFEKHSACVCDMESAAALETAAQQGVAAVAVKVVSDTAESGLRDFWRHLDANLGRLGKALDFQW